MPGWRRLPTPPRNLWGGYIRDKNGNLPPLWERIRSVPQPVLPPSAVDVWVNLHRPMKREEELCEAMAGLSDHSMPSLEYLLNYDMVECHLHAVETPGEIDGPFQDPTVHTLHLTLQVPPSTGFLVYFNKSPTVIFEEYTEHRGPRQPDWTTLHAPLVFRQPRAQMVELLAFLAQEECNQEISRDVLDWCHSVTLSNPRSPIASRAPTSPRKKTMPINIRPHKNRHARPQLSNKQLHYLRRSWRTSQLELSGY